MGKGGSMLNWLLLGGVVFLGYEYLTHKGGQYDYISKIMDSVSSKGGNTANYARSYYGPTRKVVRNPYTKRLQVIYN